MRKFVIDRSRWLRGEGRNRSRLLRSRDQKRCCLGLIAEQCGVDDRDIMDGTELSHLWPSSRKSLPEQLCSGPKVQYVMNINDDFHMRGEERERQLTEKFAALDIEVEFVDKMA